MRKFFIVATVISLFLSACNKILNTPEDKVVIPVSIRSITNDTINENQRYVGIVEADKSVALSFEVGGFIKNIYVKEGQKVNKGQLLAEIDDRSALNAYNAAKVTLDRAEDGYKRAESVYKKGGLTEVKWIEIQTQLDQARSITDICKKNLDNCKLYAPLSGTIGNKSVEAGMNVLPSQNVVKILDMNKISIKVNIPEKEIASKNIGQRANISIAALDTVLEGKISEIGVVADPLSHAYPVNIQVLKPCKKLLPGMVCSVNIQNDNMLGTGIQIPANIVQIDNNGQKFVWTVKDGLAHKSFIKTGEFTTNGVRIIEGLQEGDKVVTEGFHKISERTSVSIK